MDNNFYFRNKKQDVKTSVQMANMAPNANRIVDVKMMVNVILRMVNVCAHRVGREMCVPTNAPPARMDRIAKNPANALKVHPVIILPENVNVQLVIWEIGVLMNALRIHMA